MIPVIGAPFVTNPYWITRLIASVDFPVDNFVIINNNGKGEFDEELDNLCKMSHPYINNLKVCHMPANIGVAGAWNLIIKSYMMHPYWVIANDDVAFGPGLLEEMYREMAADPDLGMIHPNTGDFNIGAWDLFVIRDVIVKIFGLFDENTYPAYCEDADYIMRMQYRPIKRILGTQAKYLHGHADAGDYYNENGGSQTKKSSAELTEFFNTVNETNFEYLNEKWGVHWRVCNPTTHPFNNEQIPLSHTTYDLDFVRSKYTGF